MFNFALVTIILPVLPLSDRMVRFCFIQNSVSLFITNDIHNSLIELDFRVLGKTNPKFVKSMMKLNYECQLPALFTLFNWVFNQIK